MKYLKSLYEAFKQAIKSIKDIILASIQLERKLKAVRKLAKEFDWEKKTPEELLEAIRMRIQEIPFQTSDSATKSQIFLWDLKEERLLIEYVLKHRKKWKGNVVLNTRIREIKRLIEAESKIVVKMQLSLCGTKILTYNEDRSIMGEYPADEETLKFMGSKLKKYVRGTVDGDGKFHIEVEVVGKDF